MKLLLIDENILLGKSLEIALKNHPDMTAFKFVSTIKGLHHIMMTFNPDVIVIESSLKKCDGLLLGKYLINKFSVKVVFLSSMAHGHIQIETMAIGAKGCLPKDIGLTEFIQILSKIHLTHDSHFLKVNDGVRITKREREILLLLANGHRQIDIAQQLGISERTVHNHVYGINEKFETATVLHAVVKAIKLGMIDIN